MAKHSSHILELAKRGAEVRFRELVDELNVLTLSFPHLRDAADGEDLPVTFILRRGRDKAGSAQASRARRKMSANARKAIGDAQRKRWAEKKA
jgi:transcriptional regulator of aromatic amino acid metabolism